MNKLRRNVVVKGSDLYSIVFVLFSLLDALDDSDLSALTGLPLWLVNSWRFKCYHLEDNLFKDGRKVRPVNLHQNV